MESRTDSGTDTETHTITDETESSEFGTGNEEGVRVVPEDRREGPLVVMNYHPRRRS